VANFSLTDHAFDATHSEDVKVDINIGTPYEDVLLCCDLLNANLDGVDVAHFFAGGRHYGEHWESERN